MLSFELNLNLNLNLSLSFVSSSAIGGWGGRGEDERGGLNERRLDLPPPSTRPMKALAPVST